MSETMPLYTLCKEDLDSMDREVHVTGRKRNRGKNVGLFCILIAFFLPWWFLQSELVTDRQKFRYRRVPNPLPRSSRPLK